jgi:actin-related protein
MSAATDANPKAEGSLLLSQPIVIDNGTATVKAGFAGSSNPKVPPAPLLAFGFVA